MNIAAFNAEARIFIQIYSASYRMILRMICRVVGYTVTIITVFCGSGYMRDNTSSKTDEVNPILSAANKITIMVQYFV